MASLVCFSIALLALAPTSGRCTEILDSFRGHRSEELGLDGDVEVVRVVGPGGRPLRTIILPRMKAGKPPRAAPPFDYRPTSAINDTIPTRKWRRRKKKKKTQEEAAKPPPTSVTTESPKAFHLPDEAKNPKFLNLFTIIRFANEACSVEGGTCFHEAECKSLGGVAKAPCAKGYGVCCYLEASCGDRTSISGSVFVGGSTNGTCTYTIDKLHCAKQIRLDFLQLELTHPEEGNCLKEKFVVTGVNKNFVVPEICGSNTGRHMYLDVDETSGPIKLSVVSPLVNPFRIKVRQLCRTDPLLAPNNCLQYYTGRRGTISSFNYVLPPLRSTYMNNLNYAICIKKEAGSCSIVYTNMPTNGTEYPFEINNVDPDDGTPTIPPGQAGAEVFNCPDDYITIGGIRLCGQKLNDASVQIDFTKNYPVTDTSQGPFIIGVRTNGAFSGRGFRFDYEQKPC